MVDIQVYSQGVGYAIIIGLGFAFAILMVIVSKLLERYNGEIMDSEMLLTAKRSLPTFTVASAVVSSWTIGSTLLLSVQVCYQLGVSGAYWYGAGACVQIIMYCCLAIEIKRKAPNAHTYQEVVKYRYGKVTHFVAIGYSLIQMTAFTTNLLINGSSIFSQFTGMNRDVATVLFPIGVIIYSLIGGIKATFITDYTHVAIIYLIILVFMFKTYATGGLIGSPDKLWEMLKENATNFPVPQNAGGSYLTMHSPQGGLFGLVLLEAGFACSTEVQLMSKAISAKRPLYCYILGSLFWFSIPYCLATTLGLVAAGLQGTEYFPILTAEQIGAGVVMPLAAKAIMGNAGVGMVLVMVFMAVTAAFSSETMAISSLFTHDIYKAYVNPSAKGARLVWVADCVVVAFGVVVVGIAIGLAHAGFDVSFITTCSGIVVNVNVIPMVATLFWKKMTGFSYSFGTILCTLISLGSWMGYAMSQSGHISLATLSTNEALACGNMIAVGSPLIICPILVFIKPANFDWNELLKIKQDDNKEFDEKHGKRGFTADEATELALIEHQTEMKEINRDRKIGFGSCLFFCLFFLLLFPIPLYGSKYIFSKAFFRGWVVVTFFWAWFSSLGVICGPIYEGRHGIVKIISQILGKKTIIDGQVSYESSEVEVSLELSKTKQDNVKLAVESL